MVNFHKLFRINQPPKNLELIRLWWVFGYKWAGFLVSRGCIHALYVAVYLSRLLSEESERSAGDSELRLKKREAELRVAEERVARLEDRLQEVQRTQSVSQGHCKIYHAR